MVAAIWSIFKGRGIKALLSALIGGVCTVILRALKIRFFERNIYGYKMFLDLEDRGISRGLMLFGNRELDHKVMLESIVRPDMRIFDIGANIGYYAIMESKLLASEGRILAIEPSPSNYKLLKKNLELNELNNVEAMLGAVSDTVGTAKIHLSHQSNLNTFHNVGSGVQHLSGEQIDVETHTVPSLASAYFQPDLIRMDVEGHEVSVINGALKAIAANKMRPDIIFETHLSRYTSTNNMAKALKALFSLGYHVPLAASSWEGGSAIVESLSYKSIRSIHTDGNTRKIFYGISNEDAERLICDTGGLRTVLLSGR